LVEEVGVDKMSSVFVSRFDSERYISAFGNVYLFNTIKDASTGTRVQRIIELRTEKDRLKAAYVAEPKNRPEIVRRGKKINEQLEYIKNDFEVACELRATGAYSTTDFRRLWYGHTDVELLNETCLSVLLNDDGKKVYVQFGGYNPHFIMDKIP
jgi:hypothetical protein